MTIRCSRRGRVRFLLQIWEKKVLNDSGGKEYLERNKDTLLGEFDDIETMFDLQERAKELVREKIKEGGFDAIKEYLFKEGRDTDEIVSVMGLALRNMVFEHKGISIENVSANKSEEAVRVP